jgi:hypothetical protein
LKFTELTAQASQAIIIAVAVLVHGSSNSLLLQQLLQLRLLVPLLL